MILVIIELAVLMFSIAVLADKIDNIEGIGFGRTQFVRVYNAGMPS